MNILQAEQKINDFPSLDGGYLRAATQNNQDNMELDFLEHLALKSQVFQLKDKYHILALEDSLALLKGEIAFFDIDNTLVMLYKDKVDEKDIKYCAEQLKYLEEEKIDLEATIRYRKKRYEL